MIKQQRYQLKHKKLGLCIFCPEKIYSGGRCKKHWEKEKAYSKLHKPKIIKKRKEEGKCIRCIAPLQECDEGHYKCISCRMEVVRKTTITRRKTNEIFSDFLT